MDIQALTKDIEDVLHFIDNKTSWILKNSSEQRKVIAFIFDATKNAALLAAIKSANLAVSSWVFSGVAFILTICFAHGLSLAIYETFSTTLHSSQSKIGRKLGIVGVYVVSVGIYWGSVGLMMEVVESLMGLKK